MSDIREAISLYHLNTYMTAATGSPAIVTDRMLRLVTRYSTEPSLSTSYIKSIYAEVSSEHDDIYPENCIIFLRSCFPAYVPTVGFNNPTSSEAHFMPDIICSLSTAQLVIPMQPFSPYEKKSKARRDAILESIDCMPIFFINSDRSFGFSVNDRTGPSRLLYKGRLVSSRSSLKIIFTWPGYKIQQYQMQYGTSTSRRKGLSNCSNHVVITLERLAELVRKKCFTFIDSGHTPTGEDSSEYKVWEIAKGHGGISADDVVILGIYFVSSGAVMPILKLKEGFVFSGQSALKQSENAVGASKRQAGYGGVPGPSSPINEAHAEDAHDDYAQSHTLASLISTTHLYTHRHSSSYGAAPPQREPLPGIPSETNQGDHTGTALSPNAYAREAYYTRNRTPASGESRNDAAPRSALAYDEHNAHTEGAPTATYRMQYPIPTSAMAADHTQWNNMTQYHLAIDAQAAQAWPWSHDVPSPAHGEGIPTAAYHSTYPQYQASPSMIPLIPESSGELWDYMVPQYQVQDEYYMPSDKSQLAGYEGYLYMGYDTEEGNHSRASAL